MEGLGYTDPDDACEYFADNVRFAIFGDSHAVELAYAFADLLDEHGIGIKQFSFSACPPSYGDQEVQSDCSTWTQAAMDSIIRRENIETVIVSYRINTYLFGGHERTYPGMPMEVSETERKTVWDAYIKILQAFLVAGKKVVLVLQAPELPDRMEALIYDPTAKDSFVQGPPRDWWTERTAFLRQHLREIPAGVTVVDPADLFCDATVCYAGQHSISYYFDDDHMSLAGAGVVADEILSRLDPGHR